jgi:hypothetical protein
LMIRPKKYSFLRPFDKKLKPDSTTAKFFAGNRVCEIWMAAHEWFYWICTLWSQIVEQSAR